MKEVKSHRIILHFDRCEVVRRGRDAIYFTLSKEDSFGRALDGLQEIHNGYDEFNSRSMVIETVSGNGPQLARALGWTHLIFIIEPGDVKNTLKYIEPWDFSCKIINGEP